MKVLLRRNMFAEGVRYRAQSGGTEVPDTVDLPSDAKIWDGKEFVDVPEDEKDRKALIKKSSKAVAGEEPDEVEMPTRIYDPRYKSPDSKEPIVGQMPVPPIDGEPLPSVKPKK